MQQNPPVSSVSSVASKSHRLHLALIPDGNRRWARNRSLHPWDGHAKAVENFRALSDWCRENPRVAVLTIWCFSTENWKRDPKEVSRLMDLLENYIRKNRADVKKQGTRFLHSGRTDRIPPSLAKAFKEIAEETKDNTNFTLHLALDYGGKDEIIRAWRKAMHEKPETGNQKLETGDDPIRPFLDHPFLPDIDLIVRTSGEQRTSNFFLWQSTYAEWFFLEKHFPELTTADIEQVLVEYDQRQRRFGS